MKKVVVIAILLSLLFTPIIVQAQTPTPAEISTLGPVQIRSGGDGGTNVQIFSPQNKSTANNPIQLTFCVKALLLPYSPFGNVGYSLDNGTIYNVSNFINITRTREEADKVTVWAEVALPKLSEVSHTVTVYVGWQFSGIGQRYEVMAYSTVNFLVSSKSPTPTLSPTANPSPTVPEFPSLLIVLVLIGLISLSIAAIRKRIKVFTRFQKVNYLPSFQLEILFYQLTPLGFP